MGANSKYTSNGAGVMFAAGLLCLAPCGLQAQTALGPALLFAGDSMGLVADGIPAATGEDAPSPMILDPGLDFEFDLAGSEKRKLQLMLQRPLSLQVGMDTRTFDSGSDALGLDATLNLPVTKQFSLGTGVNRQVGHARFRALGSIQCANGTLRADSYTASDCHFVNEPLASANQQQLTLGARLNLQHATASINWFTRSNDLSQAGPALDRRAWAGGLLSPNLGNPLLSAGASSDPLQYLNSEASGVDVSFKVGFTTDTHGDLQLGLAFSRVLEADFQGLYPQDASAFTWTLAEPFDSARMNLEWSRGPFSTGIQGYYRDSVDFLNRNSIDEIATFDVHFTWRTPWNANLSVGATNLLNAGGDSSGGAEPQPADPLESIYGRIPYVRYKQDL